MSTRKKIQASYLSPGTYKLILPVETFIKRKSKKNNHTGNVSTFWPVGSKFVVQRRKAEIESQTTLIYYSLHSLTGNGFVIVNSYEDEQWNNFTDALIPTSK